MDGVNGLDLFLMAGLGLGLWRGFRTGAAQQILSTLGLLAGFVLSVALMGPIGSLAVLSLGLSDRIAPVVGFVIVFAAVLAAVFVAGKAVEAILKAFKLGAVDGAAGALLSGFKAALSLSVLLLVTALSPLPGGEPWLIGADTRDDSLLYEPVRAVAPETWGIVREVAPGVQAALAEKFSAIDSVGESLAPR
jgi:membrane protein required for colicin V production